MEYKDRDWPPTPNTPPLRPAADKSSVSPGLKSDLLIGLAIGVLLNIIVVVVGSLLIIVIGTIVFGPTHYGQTAYQPVLPFFVLDTLFVLCQLPTALLFLHRRQQRAYYAFGMLAGGMIGALFLILCWNLVMRIHS